MCVHMKSLKQGESGPTNVKRYEQLHTIVKKVAITCGRIRPGLDHAILWSKYIYLRSFTNQAFDAPLEGLEYSLTSVGNTMTRSH